MEPDVWLLPNQVWEIGADAITKSPSYSLAKKNLFGQGLSLRFPRFIRTREDKSCKDKILFNQKDLMSQISLRGIIKEEIGTDSLEIYNLYKADVDRRK
jgi:hypothetical protein